MTIKYGSIWTDKATGIDVTIGQGYKQHDLQYYFVVFGMSVSSSLLTETKIRQHYFQKGETK